jgi:hypothetical protein
MSKVKYRLVAGSNTEIEFDYIHPVTKKRVRRKLEITETKAEALCTLMNYIIENNLKEDKLIKFLIEDPMYEESVDYYIQHINTLYFNYNTKDDYTDYELEVNNLFNSSFDDTPDINLCLLGKAGVGKSSLIKKISIFADTEINFPFVDTSRTSTFSAEYCFGPTKRHHTFAVAFINSEIINSRIEECIERSVYKAISLSIVSSKETTIEKKDDTIISSFYNDPTQIFDIRLLFGKHIRKSSKNYSLSKNSANISRWNTISNYCNQIAQSTIGEKYITDNNEINYFQEKYTELIKSENKNATKELYTQLIVYIQDQIKLQRDSILSKLHDNRSINNIDSTDTMFSCNINNFTEGTFKDFISIFTSKNIEYFGNSLLPFIYKMRIEIPYNHQISNNVSSIRSRFIDTVGVAHANESTGGFEKSTQLTLEDIDAVIIVDDSRLNMSNDTGVILKHIKSRIGYQKIYFAMSFYDEFTKEQFDPEDDIDEQKTEYLSTIQKDKIEEYLDDNHYSQKLVERVDNSAIFYLEGLKYANDKLSSIGYQALNNMLNQIRVDIDISKNSMSVCKIIPNKPIVEYDYKKLSLIYLTVHNEFIKSQEAIYLSNPPHFKTTEALTRRLKNKETSFYGARTLKPVDDLYNSFVIHLNDYIMTPQTTNITGDTTDHIDSCIADLKSLLTDKLSLLVKRQFFNSAMLEEWNQLYLDYSSGVDYRRRTGIIKNENEIAPSIESYLNSNYTEHIINDIESLFRTCIFEFEKKIFSN